MFHDNIHDQRICCTKINGNGKMIKYQETVVIVVTVTMSRNRVLPLTPRIKQVSKHKQRLTVLVSRLMANDVTGGGGITGAAN